MRNYWVRIVLGALGVFAVGMAVIFVARKVIAKVKTVAESSDPIAIPLAFLPFRLDGSQLGTFDRAVLMRKTPKEVTALHMSVRLADSAGAARLTGCGLLARFTERPGGNGAVLTDADFTCVKPDSVAPAGAERFGRVVFHPGDLTLPLFVPADVAQRLRGVKIDTRVDAAADSMGEAASRMADSISSLHEGRADSIRQAALRMADSMRQRAHVLRDSIRASLRRP